MNPTIYDSEGNEVKCACGKLAAAGIMGKDAFMAWCEECNPYKSEEIFVEYITPQSRDSDRILDDSWVIDLREE